MRPWERLAVFGALAAAVVLAIGLREGGASASARSNGWIAADTKLGFVDIYALSERLMDQTDLKAIREGTELKWKQRIDTLNADLQKLQSQMQIRGAEDPETTKIMQEGQAKQQELQEMFQDRASEMEKITSEQLIASFDRIREAAAAVAGRDGYTHVVCNRTQDRKIVTEQVSLTLQELLARPFLLFPEADDLTRKVAAELKLPDIPVRPAGATGQPAGGR